MKSLKILDILIQIVFLNAENIEDKCFPLCKPKPVRRLWIRKIWYEESYNEIFLFPIRIRLLNFIFSILNQNTWWENCTDYKGEAGWPYSDDKVGKLRLREDKTFLLAKFSCLSHVYHNFSFLLDNIVCFLDSYQQKLF